METLLMLVTLGALPPEAEPPANLHNDPTSTYDVWLNSLSPNIRRLVLSKVSMCDRDKLIMQAKEGPDFAFLTFIEVASFLPRSVFWAVLFLLMVLLLGVSTMVGLMQGLVGPLQDSFALFRQHTKLLTGCICVLMYLCGLYYIRPSGAYLITLLSEYWTPMPIIFITICENVAVAWACGARRFLRDMNLMHDFIIRFYSWLWTYLTPVILLVTLLSVLVRNCTRPITYVAWNSSSATEVTQFYPSWMLIMIFILLLVVISPIPVYIFYCLANRIPFKPGSGGKGSLQRRCQIKPSKGVQEEEIL